MAHSHEQSLLARLGFADPDRKDKRHTLACQYLCEPETAKKVLKVVGLDVEPKDAPPTIRINYERANPPDPLVLSNPKFRADTGTGDDICLAKIQENIAKEYPLSGTLTERLIVKDWNTSWYKKIEKDDLPTRVAKWSFVSGVAMEVTISRRGGFLIGFADVVIRHGAVWWRDTHHEFTVEERAYEVAYLDDRAKIVTFQDSAGVDCIPEKREDRNCGSILIEVKSRPVDVADILKQIAVYRDCCVFSACVVATCYPVTATDKATLKSAGIHHIYLGDGFSRYCSERANEKPVEEDGI